MLTGFVNFGQRHLPNSTNRSFTVFAQQNLADPTIADGSTAFDCFIRTGDGILGRTFCLNFEPRFCLDEVYATAARPHVLIDTVRGRQSAFSQSKSMQSASTHLMQIEFIFFQTVILRWTDNAFSSNQSNGGNIRCLGLGRWNVNGQQH